MTTNYEAPVRLWYATVIGEIARGVATWVASLTTNRVLKRKLILVLGALAVIGVTLATAQPSGPMGSGSQEIMSAEKIPDVGSNFNSLTLLNNIAGGIDSALTGLRSNSGLKTMGDQLTAFGLFIGMLWAAIKIMVSGKGIGELIGEWTPLFVAAAVIMLLINERGAQAIESTMNTVSSTVAPGINTSSVSTMLPSTMDNIFKSIQLIFDTERMGSQTWVEFLTGSMMANLIDWAVVWTAKLVVSLLIVIAGCIYMAIAIMTQVSLSLVMALAPVMVPFLIFNPLKWIFDSWLKFLISACMMKLVGAFMLKMTTGLLAQMVVIAAQAKKDAAGSSQAAMLTYDVLLYGMMLMLAVLAGLLMMQVPSISSGLIKGDGGGGGFRGLGGVTGGLSGKVASTGAVPSVKGAQGAASLGGYAYRKLGANPRAERQGAADAKAGMPMGQRSYSHQSTQGAYAKGHAATRQAMSSAASASTPAQSIGANRDQLLSKTANARNQ